MPKYESRVPYFCEAIQRHSTGRFSAVAALQSWTRDILFATLTAILIVVFVIQPVRVEGTSMQPNLIDQERIFVNKLGYYFSGIKRGDVVVFWYPKDRNKSFIKRVVGLPGETVEVRKGIVYVDGRSLNEHYVLSKHVDRYWYPPKRVPWDSYFVMGDHRNSSNDSRHWGCVPVNSIFGKAVFRYWPVTKIGLLD